jgi:2-polyprenyl-3-methyl-5-hydroxy-6-metoxy-1,4-benzoquinol methylase
MDEKLRALSAESAGIWDANAEAWDARMGEAGGLFQRTLVAPAAERLLGVRPGQLILDVACGNGVFSRLLARLGTRVVACDFSAALIERAKARSAAEAGQVSYQVVDATDEAQLLALGEEGAFDGAVCNMALMDMAAIEPLFDALARLLKPGAPFVFSVMHPCFNTTSTLMVENWDEAGVERTVLSVKVSEYLGLAPTKGLAISGQPVPQHYFHRPLHALFAAGFRAGFAIDGLEEPACTPEQAESSPLLSWTNFTEIPPVMVVRMRAKAFE